jgi:hypothetical protein
MLLIPAFVAFVLVATGPGNKKTNVARISAIEMMRRPRWRWATSQEVLR